MIDFITSLELILKNSGREDWEIRYIPDEHCYLLILDGAAVWMIKE